MSGFFHFCMALGSRLVFWIAIILLAFQLFDDVMALGLATQMMNQPFGPQISLLNLIPKLIEAFTWPALLLAMSIVIDRLDALIARGGIGK